jgi:hypothetical protein
MSLSEAVRGVGRRVRGVDGVGARQGPRDGIGHDAARPADRAGAERRQVNAHRRRGRSERREPMDWEAMHREQQRQITASIAEDFKRRDKIRRQHLEDALAAMQPKPSTRTAEEVAELRARLQRLQQTVGLDDEEPHAPSPVQPIVDLHDPTDA